MSETRPRIFAVVNQKGGVGKTTTSINLGTALAAVGMRVLIVDFDAQGNASTGLGIANEDREITSYDVVVDHRPLESAIVSTIVPRLDMVTGHQDLSGVETELASDPHRSYRLRRALHDYADRASVEGLVQYDYILIDCPPSLSALTMNAMTAADALLVPLQCEFLALEGLSQLLQTVEVVRSGLNPALEIQGVILTMYDRRNNLSDQVADEVRAFFGKQGLQYGHSPECPPVRSAILRQARLAVRLSLSRQRGLYSPRVRNAPAREGTGGVRHMAEEAKNKTSRLGRGLSALIGEVEGAPPAAASPIAGSTGLQEIELKLIRRNPAQPRREFDEDALKELAEIACIQGCVATHPGAARPQGIGQVSDHRG